MLLQSFPLMIALRQSVYLVRHQLMQKCDALMASGCRPWSYNGLNMDHLPIHTSVQDISARRAESNACQQSDAMNTPGNTQGAHDEIGKHMDDADNDALIDLECPICLELLCEPTACNGCDLGGRGARGKHVFCKNCLLKVQHNLGMQMRCPICRATSVANVASLPEVDVLVESLRRLDASYNIRVDLARKERVQMQRWVHLDRFKCTLGSIIAAVCIVQLPWPRRSQWTWRIWQVISVLLELVLSGGALVVVFQIFQAAEEQRFQLRMDGVQPLDSFGL